MFLSRYAKIRNDRRQFCSKIRQVPQDLGVMKSAAVVDIDSVDRDDVNIVQPVDKLTVDFNSLKNAK